MPSVARAAGRPVKPIFYLAYGSNLFGPRLAARAPSARPVARVALDGWELRFHKRGWRDGSAKCDIVRLAGATVHGVVYELAARDRPALDAAEGLGDGYRELATSLPVNGAVLPIFTYVAQPSHVDPSLAPFRWYRDLVVGGAREHGLPPEYIERLSLVAAIPDPDRTRAARERGVLSLSSRGTSSAPDGSHPPAVARGRGKGFRNARRERSDGPLSQEARSALSRW